MELLTSGLVLKGLPAADHSTDLVPDVRGRGKLAPAGSTLAAFEPPGNLLRAPAGLVDFEFQDTILIADYCRSEYALKERIFTAPDKS